MNKSFYILGITLLLTSCLEEIPLSVERSEPQLVVEGYISDQSEIYNVRLSSITNFDGTGTSSSFIQNALVEITMAGGETYQLIALENGLYQTAGDFFGTPGQGYQLRVTLSNGDIYVSNTETIPENVEIVSGEAVFVEESVTDENGSTSIRRQHNIEIEIANSSQDHFYILENSAWLEVEMTYGDCGIGDFPPPAGPTVCWAFRDPIVTSQIILGDNRSVGNDNYVINAVAVPFDFKGEYIASIRLNAMSSRNYAFWNSVNEQLDRSGSIFDRPFAPIIGNISQLNGDKVALGYFHAYASTQVDICFDRSGILAPVDLPGPFPCPTLCTQVFSPATFTDVSDFFCN